MEYALIAWVAFNIGLFVNGCIRVIKENCDD
jgi:hypothetical protein